MWDGPAVRNFDKDYVDDEEEDKEQRRWSWFQLLLR